MIHRQLKINNKVIALAIFTCSQLTSCNCGNNNNDDLKSPKTNNDTSTGGTSTNTGGTGTGTSIPKPPIPKKSPVPQKPAIPGTSSPKNPSIPNTPITSQRIGELLTELNDENNPATPTVLSYLTPYLEKFENNDKTVLLKSEQKIFLRGAIMYNNIGKGYNTIDILKLAIDKSKEVIKDVYKDITFLQYAAYYNNTNAIDLLLKEGVKKDSKTPSLLNDCDIAVSPGATAYDIAAKLNYPEAMKKLKP